MASLIRLIEIFQSWKAMSMTERMPYETRYQNWVRSLKEEPMGNKYMSFDLIFFEFCLKVKTEIYDRNLTYVNYFLIRIHK